MSVTVATWQQRAPEPRFRTRALIDGAFFAAAGSLPFRAPGNVAAQ